MTYDIFPLMRGSNLASVMGRYTYELYGILKLIIYIVLILILYVLSEFYSNLYIIFLFPVIYLITGGIVSV